MDGTDRLCMALYGRPAKPADFLGGADAKMLHDAATRIADLQKMDCPECRPTTGAEFQASIDRLKRLPRLP